MNNSYGVKMKKTFHTLVLSFVVIAFLAACQASPSGSIALTGAQNGTVGTGAGTGTTNRQFGQGSSVGQSGTTGSFSGLGRNRTPTVEPTPLPTETPIPTATPVNPADLAVKTAQDYFTAVSTGNYTEATRLISSFSLRVAEMTAGDVQAALASQAQSSGAWSNLVVKESQVLDAQTILVHVTYQVTGKDAQTGNVSQQARDELWPVRLEAGKWLYNYGNVIDFHTLTLTAQTTAGLTVLPTQITRYSDRLVLTFLAQNDTNDPIVIGSQNQVLATFKFGDKSVQAQNTRFIIDRLRGYPDLQIVAQGLFTTYPDAVELVQSKNANVQPWFSFNLN